MLRQGARFIGVWLCNEAAIGHTRLAVIDIEGGAQPMVRTEGEDKYVITYNGELYNTNELRTNWSIWGKILNPLDTEVVLASYIQWWDGCLSRLNGIYAFGVWDDGKKTLFLGRDRFGVKPLFYTLCKGKLIFASEIKAILAHPNVEAVIYKNGIAEVFGLGPARTPGIGVFKDIYELKPAHFMRYNKTGMSIRRYWGLQARNIPTTFPIPRKK
jgi:asparagine synthase (glutamine-hydrolysing)